MHHSISKGASLVVSGLGERLDRALHECTVMGASAVPVEGLQNELWVEV